MYSNAMCDCAKQIKNPHPQLSARSSFYTTLTYSCRNLFSRQRILYIVANATLILTSEIQSLCHVVAFCSGMNSYKTTIRNSIHISEIYTYINKNYFHINRYKLNNRHVFKI